MDSINAFYHIQSSPLNIHKWFSWDWSSDGVYYKSCVTIKPSCLLQGKKKGIWIDWWIDCCLKVTSPHFDVLMVVSCEYCTSKHSHGLSKSLAKKKKSNKRRKEKKSRKDEQENRKATFPYCQLTVTLSALNLLICSNLESCTTDRCHCREPFEFWKASQNLGIKSLL